MRETQTSTAEGRIPVFCTQKRAERKLLMRVGEQGIWLWCRDHHMEEFIPWEDVPYAKEFFAAKQHEESIH